MAAFQDAVSIGLMIAGVVLLMIAAVGIVRLPDLFLRMSATSKASSLGAGCLFLALAVAAGDVSITVRALAGVMFLVLTTPVASHMIGRAAYLSGVPLWKGTVCDELRGRYDLADHTLKGDGPPGDRDTRPRRTADPGEEP